MKVLVTGAGGFIGRAVVERLVDAELTVTALYRRQPTDRPPFEATVVVADLRDRDRIHQIAEAGRFDAVCHIAGLTNGRESLERPLPYFDVNVGGTVVLLEALQSVRPVRDQWLRVVFASTHAVYGSPDIAHPISEDEETRPTNAYGASKLAAEQLIGYEAAAGRLGAISLRCFNVAGAVDGLGDHDRSRIIPMALAVAAGEVSEFPLNGDGSAVREFVHVADVAEAFLLALMSASRSEHVPINIGSGAGVTMMEVLKVIEHQTGHSLKVNRRPPKPEPTRVVADTRRAQQVLGWVPVHSAIDVIVRDAWAAVSSGTGLEMDSDA